MLQLIASPVGTSRGVHGASRVPLPVMIIVANVLAAALLSIVEILLDPVTTVPAMCTLAAAVDALLPDAADRRQIDNLGNLPLLSRSTSFCHGRES